MPVRAVSSFGAAIAAARSVGGLSREACVARVRRSGWRDCTPEVLALIEEDAYLPDEGAPVVALCGALISGLPAGQAFTLLARLTRLYASAQAEAAA